jgi:hypothetical protein
MYLNNEIYNLSHEVEFIKTYHLTIDVPQPELC